MDNGVWMVRLAPHGVFTIVCSSVEAHSHRTYTRDSCEMVVDHLDGIGVCKAEV